MRTFLLPILAGHPRRRARLVAALCPFFATGSTGLIVISTGCGGGTHLITERGPEQKKSSTTPTRIFNALLTNLETVTVDITTPQELGAKRLTSGSLTAYADVAAGKIPLTLTRSAPPNDTVAQLTATVGQPTDYSTVKARTIVVFGTPGAAAPNAPQAYVLTDTAKPTTLGDKYAAVRVVSVSPDLGPVDLFSGASPILGATRVTFESPTTYTPIPAGDVVFSLRDSPSAVMNDVSSPTATPLAPPTLSSTVNLIPGQAYTIFIFGERGTNLDAVVIPEP